MHGSHSAAYKASGVDINAGYRAVDLIKQHVERARTPGFLGGLGGFGGLFALDLAGLHEPVLVSGADGVGTKLRVAFLLDRHTSVGIDCVAMCVNDIICSGAKPLFFLDYLALPKNIPEKVAQIVGGIAEGCVQAGCALIGGETAEMPGMYGDDEYDLAGFAVGIVDEERMLDSRTVVPGDVIIALPSSGVHSNGFSLVRKILADTGTGFHHHVDELGGTIGQSLLVPTKIYVKQVLQLLEKSEVKSIANITGGGFFENVPRALPAGIGAHIDKTAVKTPPIFTVLQKLGGIPERDMFNVFNMGIGMCIITAKTGADAALRTLSEAGETAYIIGETEKGEQIVRL